MKKNAESHKYSLAYKRGYKDGLRKAMRPKGRWVKETELVGGHYHEMLICSNCKWTTDRLPYGMIPYGINFCPYCGADMRGDEHEL